MKFRHQAKDPSDTRLAFVGPWNFGNGLGFASRGFVSALWHCDFRLNLHPVKLPFHIHPRVAPTIDVRDFVGDADVAVINLNPDGWPALLSDDQRHLMKRARRVVGHWVWEMSEIPDFWHPGFDEVDAIWAPSRYCAEIFSQSTDTPVEVVPYVVSVPSQLATAEELQTIRKNNDLPIDARIVLYCFDGSSYLIRKNPYALLSAFSKSKLGAEGWTLVLKTKNMYESPAQAARLERLVEDTPGSILLNKSMTREEMMHLMQAADIYASPHCSEGFGLTIAEAMALGKHVIATDYGGNCDFLDATCGYPINYTVSPLAEDHGHYTSGKSWAAVDEGELAAALRRAAEAVANDDDSLPRAARARISQDLSARAVGARIKACVANLE